MDNWEFALEENGEKVFKQVNLPHDWAITQPFQKDMEQGEEQGYRKKWGIGWYRKKILLDKKEGNCYFLDFGGIYEDSCIWINGYKAGGRKYGYSPFRIEITDFVKSGENEILIKVDNTKKPGDRWYSGAGIYRTVKLIETEKNYLNQEKIIVKTSIEGTTGWIDVNLGTSEPVRVTVRKGTECYQQEGKGEYLVFQIPNAKFWSAESPELYELTVELLEGERTVDEITMKIGIREFDFIPGKGMFVNHKPVKLKGVCIHQDVGCVGIAVVKELWRERLSELKKIGCNAIRAAHHIYAEEFLDLCDEMGFYLYEECFDKWTGGLYGRYFETEWKKDLTCMVERDRNRASIFIWGVGNEVENQAQPSMLRLLKMLKAQVETLDDTRPISYAMNPHFKRQNLIDVSKVENIQQFVDEEDETEIYDLEERIDCIVEIGKIVDIISCNYQEQWYEKIHERLPDKLILGTEIYQFFKGYEKQTQNYCIENPSLVPFAKDYVIGGFIWTGFDYLGESMGYPSKGWSGSLMRTNGVKRPSYYLLQSYWSKNPMVYFAVMDYSLEDEFTKEHWDMPMYAEHWHFPQFHKAVIPYMIATNCDEVQLFLNDRQIYLSAPEKNANHMITGFLPYEPGKVKVVGYIEGQEVCSHEVVTPETPVQLIFEKGEQLEVEAKTQYLFTVRACDEWRNPYFRESSQVRFCVEGAGEILAVDNGNLMSSEPYDSDSKHMYRGQASVLVKSGKEGAFRISAYASGMRTGSIWCAIRNVGNEE